MKTVHQNRVRTRSTVTKLIHESDKHRYQIKHQNPLFHAQGTHNPSVQSFTLKINKQNNTTAAATAAAAPTTTTTITTTTTNTTTTTPPPPPPPSPLPLLLLVFVQPVRLLQVKMGSLNVSLIRTFHDCWCKIYTGCSFCYRTKCRRKEADLPSRTLN